MAAQLNPSDGLMAGPSSEPEISPEIRAIPGVFMVLDGGVPWTRDLIELDTEWRMMMGRAAPLMVGGQIDPGAIGYTGRALLGMIAAARWTTDRTDLTPMRPHPEVVTGRSVREQLGIAEDVMVSREAGWDYATGVLEWILWITGARENLAGFWRLFDSR